MRPRQGAGWFTRPRFAEPAHHPKSGGPGLTSVIIHGGLGPAGSSLAERGANILSLELKSVH